jgi:hypothetical protein
MSKDLWQYNHVQFPRLLSEIMASGCLTEEVWDTLLESMDLESDELSELFERAQKEWETIKNMHRPPSVHKIENSS